MKVIMPAGILLQAFVVIIPVMSATDAPSADDDLCAKPRTLWQVDNGRRWIVRHRPDGRWDIDGYQLNCVQLGLGREPGVSEEVSGDVAATGLALLSLVKAMTIEPPINIAKRLNEAFPVSRPAAGRW